VRRRQGLYPEAVGILEEVFSQSPRAEALANDISLTYGAIRRNEEAAAWAERAILLGGAPSAYQRAARAYLRQGDVERARAVLSRAQDSASAFVIDAGFWTEAYGRDFDAAASWLRKAPGPILEFQATRIPAALYWARLHEWAGRPNEAREAFQQAVTELRARDQGGRFLAMAYAGLGQRDSALAEIDATVREWRAVPDPFDRPIPFPEMAVVRVLLGDHDAAVDLLEDLLVSEYDFALTVADLRLDPTWDRLRDYPRFRALLERYGDDVGDDLRIPAAGAPGGLGG
jgi:tetratricopeptide (TPR) repeat protein